MAQRWYGVWTGFFMRQRKCRQGSQQPRTAGEPDACLLDNTYNDDPFLITHGCCKLNCLAKLTWAEPGGACQPGARGPPPTPMSSLALSSILVVLSIAAIIYLTAKIKFNVFGALFAVSLALAMFGTNLPMNKVVDALKTGFGNTLGGISFIIIFGAAIAVCMGVVAQMPVAGAVGSGDE